MGKRPGLATATGCLIRLVHKAFKSPSQVCAVTAALFGLLIYERNPPCQRVFTEFQPVLWEISFNLLQTEAFNLWLYQLHTLFRHLPEYAHTPSGSHLSDVDHFVYRAQPSPELATCKPQKVGGSILRECGFLSLQVAL